jgi:hypothetical protein
LRSILLLNEEVFQDTSCPAAGFATPGSYDMNVHIVKEHPRLSGPVGRPRGMRPNRTSPAYATSIWTTARFVLKSVAFSLVSILSPILCDHAVCLSNHPQYPAANSTSPRLCDSARNIFPKLQYQISNLKSLILHPSVNRLLFTVNCQL